jgi:hypothetical protein
MINFELDTADYLEIYELNILNVSSLITSENISNDIKSLINFFNDEYTWDNMFTFDDVKCRLADGHYMFILYYDVNPIGYMFYEPKANNVFYLYNLYVTNKIKRPKYSPIWFVNKSIKLLPSSVSKVICVSDKWNTAAQNVFKSNNFKEV